MKLREASIKKEQCRKAQLLASSDYLFTSVQEESLWLLCELIEGSLLITENIRHHQMPNPGCANVGVSENEA